MQLDRIDKQVLNVLFNNGRESLENISTKVLKSNQKKMSHTGIAKRISKLKDFGILQVQGNINITALNYCVAFFLIEMKGYNEIKKIIENYSECPRIILLAQVTGQYSLIFGVVGQDMEVLRRYINYCGPTNKQGILHSEIIFTSDLMLPKFLPINLFSGISKEHKCENVCRSCETYIDSKCGGCGNF